METIRLPREFTYAQASAMPGSENTEVRVRPTGPQEYNSGGTQIHLSASQRMKSFMDPSTTYIRGKLKLTTATGGALTDVHTWLGTWWSLASRYDLRAGQAYELDSIIEPGVAINALMNMILSKAEKQGLSSVYPFREDETANLNTGLNLTQTAATTKTYEFMLPLIGVLNCDKMIPLDLTSLDFYITLDNIANCISGAVPATLTFQISDVELIFNQIELDQGVYNLWRSEQNGLVQINSESYLTAINNIQNGSIGVTEIPIGVRCNSLKSMLCCFTSENASGKKVDGICPNLQQSSALVIGGKQFPQMGLDPINKPSDVFNGNQKALGALYSPAHTGSVTKTSFYRADSAQGLMSAFTPTLTVAPTATNQFYLLLDVETLQHAKETIKAGISMNTSTVTFRANISAAVGRKYDCRFYAIHNRSLVFDYNMNSLTAIY